MVVYDTAKRTVKIVKIPREWCVEVTTRASRMEDGSQKTEQTDEGSMNRMRGGPENIAAVKHRCVYRSRSG